MNEFGEINIEEYKIQKQEERKKQLSEKVLNKYIRENGIKKKQFKAKNRYRGTQEYVEVLNAMLSSDCMYQKYLSEEVTPELEEDLKKYNETKRIAYLKQQEQKQREQEKKERQRRKKQDFDDWLKGYNLEGKVDQSVETLGERIRSDIETRLLEDELAYAEYVDYDGFGRQNTFSVLQDVPLSARDINLFLEWFQEQLDDWELILYLAGHEEEMADEYLYQALLNGSEQLRYFLNDAECGEQFEEIIRERIDQQIDRFGYTEKSEEYFTEEKILELIFQNPHYPDLKKELKEIESERIRAEQILEQIESEISNRIPKEAKDLYPEARAMKRHFILHIGPTNSGKTHDALKAFREAENGVYLAPLRLLALEVYEDTLSHDIPCNMKTGEEEIYTEDATHVSQTVETVQLDKSYDVAVIDECQMINEKQRGGAWSAAIMGLLAREIHLCAAPHAEQILKDLIAYCGDTCEVVRHERKVPLSVHQGAFRFPRDVQPGDALIVFSKKAVLACAAELNDKGIHASAIYGALPYDVRKKETERFLNHENQVMIATDAIGMGLNMPIQRVCFLETEKFDGESKRMLRADEIQQIAGRAGRMGIFPEGFYTAAAGKNHICQCMQSAVPPITEIRLGFPKRLIAIPGEVSDIMERWSKIVPDHPFVKADISQQIDLSRELETETNDKDLVYAFATVPFNPNNESLKHLWYCLFHRVLEGDRIRFQDYDFMNEDDRRYTYSQEARLQNLEEIYQKYDMLYFLIDRYGDPKKNASDKEKVSEQKKLAAEKIAEILSTKKFVRKQCRDCGRALPWNYKFGICQHCYEERQQSRYYRYDWDDADDWY